MSIINFVPFFFVILGGWIVGVWFTQHHILLPYVQEETYKTLRRYGRLRFQDLRQKLKVDTNNECDATNYQLQASLTALMADGLVSCFIEENEEDPALGELWYRPTGNPYSIRVEDALDQELLFEPV